MTFSVSRTVRSALVAASLMSIPACGDSAPRVASVVVPANATSALTLSGPSGTSLTIPPGASATEVVIGMTVPPTRRTAPTGTAIVATPVRLSPAGAKFDRDLHLTIPITPTSLPPGKTIDDVVVVRAPQDGDVLVPVPTRRAGNAVVAETEHFSDFLAVVFTGAAPFGACADRQCTRPSETCDTCPFDCGTCSPPEVLTVEPSGGSTGVFGDTPLRVTFDEPLLVSSVDGTTFAVTLDGVPVEGNTSAASTSFVFWSTLPWNPGSIYTIEIGAVTDEDGNARAHPYFASFTTGNAHRLVSSSPLAGATGVDPAQPITLSFSGPVDTTTFLITPSGTSCTIGVRLSTDGFATCVSGTVTFSPTADLVTITPSAPLAASTQYAIELTPEAHDESGFSLATTTPIAFTTL